MFYVESNDTFLKIKSEFIWSDYSTNQTMFQGDLTLCVNAKHNNWIISFDST
jgi:hypothetical protein